MSSSIESLVTREYQHGFVTDVAHFAIFGRCAECAT